MAPPQYNHWFKLVLMAVVSLFWGFVVILKSTWGLIVKGPRRVFFSGRRWTKRPEVLDNPELGTHHYARLENVRLHYVAKGQEGRPLLLMLHGFPELWYSWRYQLREFGDDYRTVAVDLRGYGESSRPQGISEFTMEKLTEDIKQLIEYLGYKKCYLVGHDWGGAIAWYLATKYPSMVDKLVICNAPNLFVFETYMQSTPSQLLKSWYMFLFQWPILAELLFGADDLEMLKTFIKSKECGIQSENMTQDDLDAFRYTFRNYVDRTGPINYYRAILRYKPERLSSVKVKATTLIIWGTRDAFLERQLAELSKKYVENTCYIKNIEGASHWVQQDEPELVNKYIRDFLTDNREFLQRE